MPIVTLNQTCQLSRFCRESPSFSSNLPVSRFDLQMSQEIATVAFFNFFSINFVACVAGVIVGAREVSFDGGTARTAWRMGRMTLRKQLRNLGIFRWGCEARFSKSLIPFQTKLWHFPVSFFRPTL